MVSVLGSCLVVLNKAEHKWAVGGPWRLSTERAAGAEDTAAAMTRK